MTSAAVTRSHQLARAVQLFFADGRPSLPPLPNRTPDAISSYDEVLETWVFDIVLKWGFFPATGHGGSCHCCHSFKLYFPFFGELFRDSLSIAEYTKRVQEEVLLMATPESVPRHLGPILDQARDRFRCLLLATSSRDIFALSMDMIPGEMEDQVIVLEKPKEVESSPSESSLVSTSRRTGICSSSSAWDARAAFIVGVYTSETIYTGDENRMVVGNVYGRRGIRLYLTPGLPSDAIDLVRTVGKRTVRAGLIQRYRIAKRAGLSDKDKLKLWDVYAKTDTEIHSLFQPS